MRIHTLSRATALTAVCLAIGGCFGALAPLAAEALPYAVVDTGQAACYDARGEIACPQSGDAFDGQDAQFDGNPPRYTDHGDGTVTDWVTGLMWQQGISEKVTYAQALAGAAGFALAGHDDWRLPTIKELYSLVLFSGLDLGPESVSGTTPFIDTDYFAFAYGDTTAGERIIDAQWASATTYVGSSGFGALVFGVNFADGRIKGYPVESVRPGDNQKTFFVRYVRGNPDYGHNQFVDHGDGTVSDLGTGLTWARDDSGAGMDWEAALAYVQTLNAEQHLGYDDWRLPNAKELQSIVDYGRAPEATGSPALDPVFGASEIVNEAGERDWGYYWTGTTHASVRGGQSAVYVAFGRALGYMNGRWSDVHGAGAQRSDPKAGSASQYPSGNGPQGDAVRIDNLVRVVRGP